VDAEISHIIICKPVLEKYRAIIEVENGGKKSDIAKKHIPLNTLSALIKNADKIKS
jgi:hypothetical protein